MQRLPKEPPQEPLSHSALIEAIVRIYVRQVRREGLLGPGEGNEGGGPIGVGFLAESLMTWASHIPQVSTVEGLPVWGAQRTDTVYDAIMSHYQAQAPSPGTFAASLLEGPDGPVARLIRSCPPHEGGTKVATFCFFLGTSRSGVRWSRDAWHFFLHLLHALKLLLAGGCGRGGV